ncbi:MAG: right-handed parallel beta-helix repeat-containing protein [Verrucomicrobiota bacterium]
MTGRYGYLLKLELRGQPEQAAVRSLEIVTWVQVHPASLPSLRKGKNSMRLVTGDHYGLPTRVAAVCPSAAEREAFLKHLVEPPKDYDPARRTSRVRGSVVARIQAPPGTKIAWFSAGGSFTANVGAARNTRNAIAYAVSEPSVFREIYRADVPSDQSHWHYNVDREVKLDEPVRSVFVRYTGEPAVNNLRIFAHCVEDRPRTTAPVVLTHEWSKNGARKTRQVKLDGPGEYEIEANADLADESIEMAIPSVAQTATRPSGTGGKGRGEGEKHDFPISIQPPVQSWFPKAPPLPAPQGEVIRVATVEELFTAVARVKPGGTVLIADGLYWLPRCLRLRTDRVTLRGESGDRTRVIFDGARSQDGELVALHACSGVTLANLTVQNVRHNGIKINSDSNVQRLTLHNCILHNIWQRAVKGVKVPLAQRESMRPKDCRIQYCLFYNDRPKRFDDDPADTPQNFGGIDVMYARGWTISDNVFVGIQGRTRGAVFLWPETEDCVVERNIIIDCDTGIALGNSHKPAEVPMHATRCVVRNNFITRAPENGIVADYTRDCQIVHNTIHDPTNRLGRLIRLVHDNDGLLVANNLLSGPPLRNESSSGITLRQNPAKDMTDHFAGAATGNLHLKAPLPEAVGPAEAVDGVVENIDRQPRRRRPDLGADEVGAAGR